MFENHRKSLIQHCERSELRLHFEWTKVKLKNAKNGPIWRVFENLKLAVKQSYQTGQFLVGQKLVENAKIQKFKCDNLGDFQTLSSGDLLISLYRYYILRYIYHFFPASLSLGNVDQRLKR